MLLSRFEKEEARQWDKITKLEHALYDTSFRGMNGDKTWKERNLRKMFPSMYKHLALSGKEGEDFMKSIIKKK